MFQKQLELPDSSYGRQTSVRCKKTTCTKLQLQKYKCTKSARWIDESQKGSVCAGGSGKVVIGKVISVASSEEYVSCVMCYCKLLDSCANIVQCDKCGATKRKENCKRSKIAKVIIEVLDQCGQLMYSCASMFAVMCFLTQIQSV